jgi:hypothetical protein
MIGEGAATQKTFAVASVPTATEFIEFARKSKFVNLDVSLASVLESSDAVLRGRGGYVVFNIRCGLLIIDHALDVRQQFQ